MCSSKNEAAGRLRFFSDKKIFAVDVKVNQRNDRWLVHDPDDVPVVARTKLPTNVHVLSVISSESDVMPLYFFKKGETITKEVYLQILKTVLKSWMEIMASERLYIFQQDGASGQTSHLVQSTKLLAVRQCGHGSKGSWPSNNPNLNSLNYYV